MNHCLIPTKRVIPNEILLIRGDTQAEMALVRLEGNREVGQMKTEKLECGCIQQKHQELGWALVEVSNHCDKHKDTDMGW